MSIKLHNLVLEGERESAWKEVISTLNHKTSVIDRVLGSFKTGGLVDKENLITNSKTFLLHHLRTSIFNSITKDGSGGKEFANEVSKFILKEVRRVMNDMGTLVLLPFNDKDVDKGMKEIDFDYIMDELNYYFNVGSYFTDNNIDPYIDNGIEFEREFYNTFMSLSPQIKGSIEKIIKDRV